MPASRIRLPWHYLVVTAANDAQAAAYESQIARRRGTGPLARVGEVLVLADTDGRRIGSGGSTINCLLHILDREGAVHRPAESLEQVENTLRKLRILILHAGGDSRRLPAYSACGKIFVPLPGASAAAVTPTLFDRLVEAFLALPPGPEGSGQMVVASGDALICFEPETVDLSRPGLTALAASAASEEASRHGVFCSGESDSVRLYLQKPPLKKQISSGALAADGKALLDVGVMSFSADATAGLLGAFCRVPGGAGEELGWDPRLGRLVLDHGLDLYREVCCAMGTEVTFEHYLESARGSGSAWPDEDLAGLFQSLRQIPLHVRPLRECCFLHFGSTRQLIESGLELVERDRGAPPQQGMLVINSSIENGGSITGRDSWVEACRVRAALSLGGRNVVVGVEVSAALKLGADACLDVSRGFNREHAPVWFVRCYGVEDSFKHPSAAGGTFNGMPLAEWLEAAGVTASAVWDADTLEAERTPWNARVFPAEAEQSGFTRWLWMHEPRTASPEQLKAFLEADRYSAAEIALRLDQDYYRQIRQPAETQAPREDQPGLAERGQVQ